MKPFVACFFRSSRAWDRRPGFIDLGIVDARAETCGRNGIAAEGYPGAVAIGLAHSAFRAPVRR